MNELAATGLDTGELLRPKTTKKGFTMEHLKMKTADMASENFEKLKALFPNCVTESLDKDGKPVRAIDKDLLMQEINSEVVEGQKERYQFNWPGKRDAIRKANAPTTMTLRPCKDESVDFDNTQNLYIEGDNLEVLKLLQNNYLGKVKMIYIDPPYNTGNDFVYNDNFKQDSETFLETSGMFDEDGNMTLQNFEKNSESNGRFHTDWLNMMYPRLKVARNLLSDDGVIFISIDDNEQANLQKVCDDVFSESNLLSEFIWEKRTSRENRKVFSVNHDYIIAYAKNKIEFELNRGCLPYTEEIKKRYKNPDNDPRGPWQSIALTVQGGHGTKTQFYSIKTPGGRIVDVPSGLCWRYTQKKLDELIADNRIYFGTDGNNVPRLKAFLNEMEQGITPHTLWTANEVGTNDSGKKELLSLFNGTSTFETPKPVSLLNRILTIASKDNNFITLDFFSGSATIAHSVMQLNAEDNGNRKYICVQLPEATAEDSEAYKAGYKTICEIGKERIRRAGDQILELSLQNLEKEGIVEKYARELPEIRSLEEVYGSSGIGLCLGEEVAEGGNIRSVGSNSQGCGVDSVEHSGVAISGEQGVCPVFENSKGITSGTGNTIVDLRTLKILNENGYRIKLEALGRNQQNDLFADKAFDIKGLSSKLSVLNSDRGFRVLKLAESNMNDVYYKPADIDQGFLDKLDTNIKRDRTPMDLLFQVMLECDLELSSKIEEREINGKKVFFVNDKELVACFDENIDEVTITEIAKLKPYYFIMRDSSLATDNVADNFEQLWNAYSKDTIRKVL